MKHYNLLLWVALTILIAGVIMNIAHVSNSNLVVTWSLLGGIFIQSYHIKKLNQRISELEQKS